MASLKLSSKSYKTFLQNSLGSGVTHANKGSLSFILGLADIA
jgi:hypothetical protein